MFCEPSLYKIHRHFSCLQAKNRGTNKLTS
uniref:Uncharacterized protein n=1 Tax=Arundo donax TaxID=35708 RepID=A0A0A9HJF3_ARUDO